jgi:hypothetical protein
MPPPPTDFDMNNWQTSLSQSEPSIQSRQNQLLNRLTNSSSYKVSIGHETVNITEIARQHGLPSDATASMMTTEKRRIVTSHKGANILSLCFMCFVSASLILISISTMNLILKTNSTKNNNDIIPHFVQSINNTSAFIYILSISDTVSNLLLPTYDRFIRELATVICLLIIVLNCFCVLIFSIEIYLGCNMIKNRYDSYR